MLMLDCWIFVSEGAWLIYIFILSLPRRILFCVFLLEGLAVHVLLSL